MASQRQRWLWGTPTRPRGMFHSHQSRAVPELSAQGLQGRSSGARVGSGQGLTAAPGPRRGGGLVLRAAGPSLHPGLLPITGARGRATCSASAAQADRGQAVSTGQGPSPPGKLSQVSLSASSLPSSPPLPFVLPRTPRGLLLPVTQGEGSRLPLLLLTARCPVPGAEAEAGEAGSRV